MDHDRLFKELLSTFFVDFLELFFPDVAEALDRDSMEFLDKEVFTDVTVGKRHEADLVVRALFREQPSCFLIHVEHQAQPQADFAARMFSYFARLHEKFSLPVYPIALFSYERPKRTESRGYRVAVADFEVLSFHYRVVELNQLAWRNFVDRTNPLVAALMARMCMDPADRPLVKVSCLRMLASLQLDPAREALISGFVDSYLDLTMEEQQVFDSEFRTTTPQEQERVMEIVTSWMRDGIAQGLQQGLEQGRAEGRAEGKEEGKQEGRVEGRHSEALSLISSQLVKRFDRLDPDLNARLEQLSIIELETLAVDWLDFSSLSDLRTWLENRPQSGK